MEQAHNKAVSPIHVRYLYGRCPVYVRYKSGHVPDKYRTYSGQRQEMHRRYAGATIWIEWRYALLPKGEKCGDAMLSRGSWGWSVCKRSLVLC